MWCKICSYGSAVYKGVDGKCSNCGSTELLNDNPNLNRPKRSIRAMNKRKLNPNDKKKAKGPSVNEEIEGITKGHLKARDYTALQ